MKKYVAILFLLCFSSFFLSAQNPSKAKTQAIVEEGKLLYQLEKSAWISTDVFRSTYDAIERVGGYFSCMEGDSVRCLFFSNEEFPKVLGTLSYHKDYADETPSQDFTERVFTQIEKDAYEIRQETIIALQTDTLFKQYDNTRFNIIPVVDGKEKRVYVLTAPIEHGFVLFGNDYLLTFDQNNQLKEAKALHQNLIPVAYGQEEPVERAYHTHLESSGPFITPTDVCTLMLYGQYTAWKYHDVHSEDFLSMWNCKTHQLLIMSQNELDKIYQDMDKRNGKDKKGEKKN